MYLKIYVSRATYRLGKSEERLLAGSDGQFWWSRGHSPMKSRPFRFDFYFYSSPRSSSQYIVFKKNTGFNKIYLI